jgi:hypothetical protein
MIMLYKGLVGSELEYGSVCYSGIARTHMLRLEMGSVSRDKDSSGPHVLDLKQ